jgi:hypothetical protein
MKILKKFFRLLLLICLIFLASFGAGAMLTPNFRERYLPNETRTELVEKEDEEEREVKE